ncbi:MAG: glycine-rich protein [Bacilli bacterium]|nr:glycine-rich protein [Bacilli bacterium]
MINLKKNAFTLIEVIAVIAIMGILITLVIPSIFKYVDSLKTDSRDNLIDVIKNNSEIFATRHKDEIEDVIETSETHVYEITIASLIEDDLMESPVIDPVTNEALVLDKKIYVVKIDDENLKVCYGNSECGLEDTIVPVITLLGTNNITIDINGSYIDAGATALDNLEGNITSRITATGTVNPTIAGTYTITYTVSDLAGNEATPVIRTINVFEYNYAYSYVASAQTFTVPYTGSYTVELWGAQGGDAYGSKGAYTKGTIVLTKNQALYIYIGQQGTYLNGGWNGGGNVLPTGVTYSGTRYGSGGGGATDIRTTSGVWNDTTSLRSRIMIAAGGGGAGNGDLSGTGVGGALTGGSSPSTASVYGSSGGSQTAGGSYYTPDSQNLGVFGKGGTTSATSVILSFGGGGGGGYYGGGGNVSATNDYQAMSGGGGGSSFMSGYTGCNAINSSGVHTGQPNHFSGLVFTNGLMSPGNHTVPKTTSGTETGHPGNGYAKINFIP